MATDKYAGLRPTPERDALNSIAHWFPKIENCGLPVPKTLVFPVPRELIPALYMENGMDDYAAIDAFVEGTVRPAVKAAGIGLFFLKNGSYSHKFDAGTACLPQPAMMTNAVINIMQGAMERCGFQYDGTDVLAVRERIGYDRRATPCIYSGLPFRTEYRVFYDFDDKKPVFIVDYWDRDYVRPNLYDMTDKIVFDAHYPVVRGRYEAHRDAVLRSVSDAMSRVDGLHGPWSVDVMEDERGTFWLIDMAVAEMSAYWECRPGAPRKTPAGTKAPREGTDGLRTVLVPVEDDGPGDGTPLAGTGLFDGTLAFAEPCDGGSLLLVTSGKCNNVYFVELTPDRVREACPDKHILLRPRAKVKPDGTQYAYLVRPETAAPIR